MCIFTQRNSDVILFHHEGGIDIGDVDSKVNAVKFTFAICSCGVLCVYMLT